MKAKKSIKKRILTSQISIIIISLLLTVIVFNIALRIYIRNQAKTQFASAGKLLHKSVSSQLTALNSSGEVNYDKQEATKLLLQINRSLKETQFILDINYGILGKNRNLIYPKGNKEDTSLIENEILPALENLNANKAAIRLNRIEYLKLSGKEYACYLYPIKSDTNTQFGYLLLYSDLTKSNRLLLVVNLILLSILFITAIAGFIISNITSKKISKPISELNKIAMQIGDRDFILPDIKYDDLEIEQLANSMEAMAKKLFAYDDTIKTFLQNASHELRTPLMSIQGYAEGIKYGVVDSKENAVNIIIDESKRLSLLVEELLYLSKLDSMQDIINMETVNADNLIRSCIERVNGIALNTGKVINFLRSDRSLILNADEEKLSRAIINILGNSLRYAKENIWVSLYKDNNRTVIEIKDDGPGIDEEDVGRIFDRFFKGKGGKYGLGLAIARTIVEKHNGSIFAENNAAGGAVFKIML